MTPESILAAAPTHPQAQHQRRMPGSRVRPAAALCCAAAAALLLAAAPVRADDGVFTARLSGAQEAVFDADGNFVPGGVDSAGTGRVVVRFNDALSVVHVVLRVRNLTGTFLAAHLHCGRAGENGPVAFGLMNPGPLAFDGKRLRGQLDNDDYTGADCAPIVGRPVNNVAALAQAMADGLIYANVHTDFAAAGEVRGQLR